MYVCTCTVQYMLYDMYYNWNRYYVLICTPLLQQDLFVTQQIEHSLLLCTFVHVPFSIIHPAVLPRRINSALLNTEHRTQLQCAGSILIFKYDLPVAIMFIF